TLEDGHLIVRGKTGDDGPERQFLHRGIAARQFQRSFVLADRVEVEGATLEKGLLHIDLMRHPVVPEVKQIKINGQA
ncbi:MAG: Hsp20 family protein, partial [Pseudomonadota bacterium]